MRFPKLYQAAVRFPKTVLVVSLVLTLVAAWAAGKLSIENDMTALLPRETESVRNLHQLKKFFGGAGYLIVALESADRNAAEGFADAFDLKLQAHPSILYVDSKAPVDFFKKRLWLYLDVEDLHEMEWRVDRAIELQKKGVSPTFAHIMDFAEPEDRPDLTFRDIFEKYKKRAGMEIQERAGDGSMVLLRVKVKDNSENLDQNRRLMEDVRAMEASIRAEHPEYAKVFVGYTGGYATKLEQLALIQREVTWVSIAVSLLLLLILLFYFRRFSALALIGLPLAASLVWTGGLVYAFLGHLNMMTGFGAAILGGVGSDYGIYLLTRYYQERRAGHGLRVACREAFGGTGKATYGSMITMVAGFVALLFSKFGVFIEFGVVGAVGLATTYVGMMSIIPALLTLSEKWRVGERWARYFPKSTGSSPSPSASSWVDTESFQKIFYPRKAFAGVVLVFLICGISSFTLPAQSKIFFEEGQMESPDLPGNRLGARINEMMGYTADPTVLIAHGAAEEEKIVSRLQARLQESSKDSHNPPLVYNRVLGLSSFLPTSQPEKRKILFRIADKLGRTTLLLKGEKDYLLQTLRDSLSTPVTKREDIPPEITRLFEAIHQEDIYAVFLFPAFSRADSESMKRYQDGINGLKKELGLLDVEVADGTFIASDTVRLIEKEAPRGFLMVFAFLAVVLFTMVKSWTRGLIILANLLGSLFLLSGLLWLTGIRLNIMNIAVIPVILGGGVDIYIHFSHRFDEGTPLRDILKGEVPAMFVSSLTSMVGFGGFLLVSSVGLRSIGWVAVLGLGWVTLMAVFVFPRFLLVGTRFQKAAGSAKFSR